MSRTKLINLCWYSLSAFFVCASFEFLFSYDTELKYTLKNVLFFKELNFIFILMKSVLYETDCKHLGWKF